MNDRKMEIIKELMDQLQEEMGHSPDELSERLGRPKPSLEVVSMEADGGGEDMMGDEEEMEMDDPAEKLKQRLAKISG